MNKLLLLLLISTSVLSSRYFERRHNPNYGLFNEYIYGNYGRSLKQFHSAESSVFKVESYHGYVPINQNNDDIFYWLFPAKNADFKTAPLLVWFTGGPGCSSELAVMFENGPFNVTKQGEVVLNPYSWNDKANLLYVDQPIGTGLSHSSTRDFAQTEEDVANTMLTFFDKFYTDVFPEFQKRELFLSGESFAGNYLPYISNKLYNAKRDYINLKGVAIGNGWSNPVLQFPAYADFAFRDENKQFTGMTEEQFNKLKPKLETCAMMLKSSPRNMMGAVADFCESLSDSITAGPDGTPKFNIYDITKPCIGELCYDMNAIIDFINSPAVRNELQADKSWMPCDGIVGAAIARQDENNVAAPKLRDILEADITVLVYNGVYDFACNWVGGELWTRSLEWSGQVEFAKQKFVKQDIGEARTYKNFKFLKVFNAGHMVPLDQPQGALGMINAFMGFK